jgi:hypothetical protein
MNPSLRERILRHLEPLPDERAYQVLDYIEFLEGKYGAPESGQNIFHRFAEGVEDTLRAGRVPATAIAETMGLMSKAMGVLSGVAAAGKSVASDIVDAASRTVGTVKGATTGEIPSTPPAPPPSGNIGQSSPGDGAGAEP